MTARHFRGEAAPGGNGHIEARGRGRESEPGVKEGLPALYWGFRWFWSAAHLMMLLVFLGFFLWWALTDNHAVDAFVALMNELNGVRRSLSSIVPFPWEVWRR